jgi:hypothetical protein
MHFSQVSLEICRVYPVSPSYFPTVLLPLLILLTSWPCWPSSTLHGSLARAGFSLLLLNSPGPARPLYPSMDLLPMLILLATFKLSWPCWPSSTLHRSLVRTDSLDLFNYPGSAGPFLPSIDLLPVLILLTTFKLSWPCWPSFSLQVSLARADSFDSSISLLDLLTLFSPP